MALTSRCILALSLSLAPACGSASPPSLEPSEQAILDAGPPDGGCGLSEEEAERAYPGERICPTIVYEPRSGYCRHFVRCDSF